MTDLSNFEVFMKNYQDMVYSTAVRLLGNESEAQDISQEVFLRAYHHFSSIAESPTAGGWLKTVTRNLSLNHLTRYRARWRFFSEMTSEDDDTPLDFPDTVSESQSLESADERRALELVLKKLPDSQRIPLVLFHFEGLNYEEISAQLGISLSKVKTDIFRGRSKLRHHLRHQRPSTAQAQP